KHGKKELRAMAERTSKKVPADSTLREGSSYHEIVTAAKELDVDMIIISTHGTRGLTHFFMGSTAERVVQHAPCPVLVVREREHEFISGTHAVKTSTPRKTKRVRKNG